jgi:hypothetical protein
MLWLLFIKSTGTAFLSKRAMILGYPVATKVASVMGVALKESTFPD